MLGRLEEAFEAEAQDSAPDKDEHWRGHHGDDDLFEAVSERKQFHQPVKWNMSRLFTPEL